MDVYCLKSSSAFWEMHSSLCMLDKAYRLEVKTTAAVLCCFYVTFNGLAQSTATLNQKGGNVYKISDS